MTLNAPNHHNNQRRDSMLQAAAELFGQQGFEGTSFAAVAERAGVKKSLVQYHFDNKDILWQETVRQVWQQRDAALPRYLDDVTLNVHSSHQPDQMIRNLCRQLLQFTFDHPQWVKIMFQESSAPGPRLDWMVEEFLTADFSSGSALIELAQSRGILPKVNPMDLLHILSGALIYLVNVAPITERVLGVRVNSEAYIERHIDSLITVLKVAE